MTIETVDYVKVFFSKIDRDSIDYVKFMVVIRCK